MQVVRTFDRGLSIGRDIFNFWSWPDTRQREDEKGMKECAKSGAGEWWGFGEMMGGIGDESEQGRPLSSEARVQDRVEGSWVGDGGP